MREWKNSGGGQVDPFVGAFAQLKTQGYKATKGVWLRVAKYATQGPAFLDATHWIPLGCLPLAHSLPRKRVNSNVLQLLFTPRHSQNRAFSALRCFAAHFCS